MISCYSVSVRHAYLLVFAVPTANAQQTTSMMELRQLASLCVLLAFVAAAAAAATEVVPDAMQELHTTLTPSFLGLSPSSGLLPASNGATDIVIGVIDTGVYPEGRPSFAADASLPPPPSKFRGGCVSTPSFNGSALCNNKLVGAKAFNKGQEATDIVPHMMLWYGTTSKNSNV
jgi:hypothetical protein